MLSKVFKSKMTKKVSAVLNTGSRSFSHGPYNPLAYKTVLVPEEMPS